MANIGARKSGTFKAISTAPSINKTPVGSSTPPLPYTVSQDLGDSVDTVTGVRFNGDPAYVLDQTTQPSYVGDAAGSAKRVKSGTVSGEVKPVNGSSTVRVGGKPDIRERDPCTLNDGNCPGIYVTESAPSASIRGGTPSANGNPPIKPETPEEESYWHKASPWLPRPCWLVLAGEKMDRVTREAPLPAPTPGRCTGGRQLKQIATQNAAIAKKASRNSGVTPITGHSP
jgi:hypothetical protein